MMTVMRAENDLAAVRDSLVKVLTERSEPLRSRDLFSCANVDARVGRDALAALIDRGVVVVDLDWTLRLRER